MAETGMRRIAHESINWSVGISVVMIVAGLLALAAPLAAGVALTGIIAWLLLIVGVLHLWFAWHVRGAGAHMWEALVGVFYLVAGVFLFRHPLAGLVTLTVMLGIYLVVKGCIELVAGLSTRGVAGSGWLLVDAIVSLILGGMIWFHLPTATTWVVGTLIGFSMLFSGISRLLIALAARRVVRMA